MRNFLLYLYNNIITYVPCYKFRRFYLVKILKLKISKSAFISIGCFFGGMSIKIGDDTVIGRRCVLNGDIVIGDHTAIAAYTILQAASHDNNAKDFRGIYKPIVIHDYVWVGTRAAILLGANIGKGCIVGANFLVTRDTVTEEYGIYAGSPVKKISERSQNACVYMLNYHPSFN